MPLPRRRYPGRRARGRVDAAAVEARDHGVCAACGLDTAELVAIAYHAAEWAVVLGYRRGRLLCADLLEELGYPSGRRVWEVDHIVPVWAGGSDRLHNLRTLCVPCHRRVTAAQARPRGKVRRLRERHQQHNRRMR